MDEKDSVLAVEADEAQLDDITCDDVKTEVVEASVDADNKGTTDLILRGNTGNISERFQRRKRPRRKSKKGKYPYNKTLWRGRKKEDGGNSTERAERVREMMFEHGQPVAPYNTNQFLMEDHARIDGRSREANPYLNGQAPGVSHAENEQGRNVHFPINKPSRARDSSFSVDSDDDHFYSSPEDEQEFLTKEFWSAYENVHAERLYAMSKSDIIHEFLELEEKYEKSVVEIRRLKGNTGDEDERTEGEEGGGRQNEIDIEPGVPAQECMENVVTVRADIEVMEQLRISQQENKTLKVEMEELRKQYKTLHSLLEKNHSSSVDSESDSGSSVSGDSTESDTGESSKDKTEDCVKSDEIMRNETDEEKRDIREDSLVNGDKDTEEASTMDQDVGGVQMNISD